MADLDKSRWQALLRQQSSANGKRWLSLLEKSDDPSNLIAADYENILRALESALRDSNTFNLAYQLIQLLFTTVIDYGDWDRWLIYLNNALILSQKTNEYDKVAKLIIQIGDIQNRMGLLDQAEASFQAGAQKYRDLDILVDYAHTLAKLGALYNLQGDTKKGIEFCQQALVIVEQANDEWGVAQVKLNLSSIYARARNWKKSLSSGYQSYIIFQKLNKQKEATKALINIAAISAESGDWERANTLAHELMDSLIAAEDIRTLSQLKNNLGVVAFTQSNLQLAESFWQEALILHSQIQEPTEQAGLYNNLGMVYTKMGEWEAAEEMLLKAIEAYHALGDVYNWANSLDNLADLYEEEGKTAVFLTTLQTAIDGLQSIKDSPHAKQLLFDMQQRLKNNVH